MTAVQSNLITGFEEIAARARVSLALEIQSEEHTIRVLSGIRLPRLDSKSTRLPIRSTYPQLYDAGGMLVALRGMGEWVLGNDGREVTGYGASNAPICVLAARSRELAEAAFHALVPIFSVLTVTD